MSCTVRFFLLNEDFSQEYADIHNKGQESELNKRYQWEDELKITVDVETIESSNSQNYSLKGEQNNEAFQYDVPDMHLFEIRSKQGTVVIGCSEILLDHFVLDDKENSSLDVYLKDYEPFSNPVPGIYIAAKDFPIELID